MTNCDEEYQKFVAQSDEFGSFNNGFLEVNGEMKNHVDYDLKQGLVDHNLQKQNGLKKDGTKFNEEKGAFGAQLAELKKMSDPTVLRNLDTAQLVVAVAQASDLLAALQGENEVVGRLNDDHRNDRHNLADADIYEIQDKHAAQMKRIDEEIKESQNLI